MKLRLIAFFLVAIGLGLAGGTALARTDGQVGHRAETVARHVARGDTARASRRAPAQAARHGGRRQAQARHTQARHTQSGRGRPRHAVAAPHAAGTQRGHASIYASSLAGRRMADGGRFDPRSDTVASRTLPLGGRARVTNLRNGRSAIVHVRDRGPHVRRRILDVSPGVASRLGMGTTGTAPVAVTALPGLAARAEAAPLSRR